MTICTCGQDHARQREDYPVGAKVGWCRVDRTVNEGIVTGHCDDGRAIIDFGELGVNTFHYPESCLAVIFSKDDLSRLRADLAAAMTERESLRVRVIQLRVALMQLRQDIIEFIHPDNAAQFEYGLEIACQALEETK